ncbi:MAG: hypothetical protein V3W37_05425, partial [Candidatus Binatia bacterium]
MEFVERGFGQGKRPELVGGGQIRSMGGWFEVLSLRRSGNKQASDQRILGDGDFVSQIFEEMDDLGRENLRLPTRKMDLAALAEKICEVHGIHAGELRSGSRRGEIVEARSVLSWLAV